jgi:hypothetical protein
MAENKSPAVYAILGILFYYLPDAHHGAAVGGH